MNNANGQRRERRNSGFTAAPVALSSDLSFLSPRPSLLARGHPDEDLDLPTSLGSMATASLSFPRDTNAAASILKAGATVAILDGSYVVIVYVWILHLTTASRIFQGIASRLIGKAALDGGAATALLGVLLHFTVAYSWTIAFYLALRTFAGLREFTATTSGKVIAGTLFGATVWLVMNFVIVPAFGGKSVQPPNWQFYTQLVWHMIAVGPPIVAIVRYGRT
jgi:hypothetical protein